MREYVAILRKLADELEAITPISLDELRTLCDTASREYDLSRDIRRKLNEYGVHTLAELKPLQRDEMAEYLGKLMAYTREN